MRLGTRQPPADMAAENSIAARLARDAGPGETTAFLLVSGGRAYFSRFRPLPYQPETPVTRLISGLWARFGSQALSLVRRPVLTSGPITDLDRAFVKVAAKRLRQVAPFPAPQPMATGAAGAQTHVELLEIGEEPLPEEPLPSLPRSVSSEAAAIRLVRDLQERARRGPTRATSARRLSALLTDAEGLVLAAAVNSAGTDRTRHAEAELIRRWWRDHGRGLPPGARVYCSLKPCKMCAALIWAATTDREGLRVVFDRWDPGPLAQGTVLSDNGLEQLHLPPD